MPYIHDGDDHNSISLVSRKLHELDRITRKQVTVHVHYLRNPSRLSQRFPNIESLTLIGLLSEFYELQFRISQWIRELTVSFKSLKELVIHDMCVDDEDLELLGKHVYCNQLRIFCFEDYHGEVDIYGNRLHELALHNKISPCRLSKLGDAFRHAVNLEDSGWACFDEDDEYVDFNFPPNLRCLGLYNLSATSYPFVLPLVTQLTELNLQFPYPFDPECHCFLIERCPNLEVLHTEESCGDRGLQVIGQFCKKLSKLTYCGYVRATHVGLIALAEGCLNLENLDVTLLNISNEALECIGTHLKNLGDFRITLFKVDGIKDLPLDNGIRALLNGCNKLEKLDIRLCSGGLTDIGLGYIGKYSHNLKYLFLKNIGESDAGLVELSKGCPKLRKLEMRSCPFNKQSIAAYVFNIRSLRYLRVFYEFGDLVSTRPDFGVSPTV
ncbi:hypothetical protein CTI12_AA614740 [Artemisia annua]|uniref:Uncharacterized protein n=1 Tax=Artemisia annua TaxID=35608 RepID=A0A2U1KDQ8_ARTAN|nr:hypothetical protein CTI12_AA614740 [Artemisia annua]